MINTKGEYPDIEAKIDFYVCSKDEEGGLKLFVSV